LEKAVNLIEDAMEDHMRASGRDLRMEAKNHKEIVLMA
jgi:hypothetical protein